MSIMLPVNYNYSDYLEELKLEESKGTINSKKYVKAQKSHTCEKCNCEIPKGDYYWIYKPVPTSKFWFTWRKRCLSCEPKHYEEVNHYEDLDSVIRQQTIRLDFKRRYAHE